MRTGLQPERVLKLLADTSVPGESEPPWVRRHGPELLKDPVVRPSFLELWTGLTLCAAFPPTNIKSSLPSN